MVSSSPKFNRSFPTCVPVSSDIAMAMAINLCRLPCLASSRTHRWNIQPTSRRRAARIVVSYAADAASYSSQPVPKVSTNISRPIFSPSLSFEFWISNLLSIRLPVHHTFVLLIFDCIANVQLPKSSPKPKLVAGVDQNNLVDPWLLAERDSRFAELFGVQLHYKIAHPSSGIWLPFILSMEYCSDVREFVSFSKCMFELNSKLQWY